MKPVLIVEHCMDGLKPLREFNTPKGEYILGGTFTEFGIKNRNDRIYTAEKFIPHLNELLNRKKQLGVVYGEFDHPDVFDTSLSRVSHTIENAQYVKESNIVKGEIRLLNTHWGKEAKALVDDGCPIFVSSRAAGITESDGTVTVKKLFTYDAVADPGFSSARMEVRSLNESLGFNESSNFRVYDISDESKINELFKMNEDFVTKKQMVEYSNYLTEEIEKFKTAINESIKGNTEFDPSKLETMLDYHEKLHEQQTKIGKYLDYLAEKLQFVVNENIELKKTTTGLIKHSDYLAENVEKIGNYSEYLAENIDKSIDYGKYVAETLDKNIDFSEYIAEHVDKNIKYSEYLAESLDKSIDYSEYIAESLDKSIDYSEYVAENLDKSIEYSEYLAESLDSSIVYSEYIAENLDSNIAYSEYIAEHVDNNISYSEYIAEHLDDSMAYTNYIAENLDKTIESSKLLTEQLKTRGKVNEAFEFVNEEDEVDVDQYYEDDDDSLEGLTTQAQPEVVDQDPTAVNDAQPELPTKSPVDVPVEEPVQGEEDVEEIDVQDEEDTEDSDISGIPAPGETVAIGDQTGEVMATNAQTGIVVVQLDVPDENGQVQEVEVHESKVTRLGSRLNKVQTSLKDNINKLILETKKRKVSEEDQPHFLMFLTEKRKAAYYALSDEDKTKVKMTLNENVGKYTSESQVISFINEALSPKKKSFNELLLDAMPSELTPIWEKLDSNIKNNIIATSRLFPALDTVQKFESFWYSRDLERYTNEKPSKQLITENRLVDGSKLTESQLDRFKSVFDKLNS
jgi:hypothetical protein